MTYPNLAIGIITYNRPREFESVFNSIINHVKYPSDKITFVLSDDGSAEDYVTRWTNTVPAVDHLGFKFVILRNNRLGMAGNWNAMIRECEKHADYTVCWQDDWLLTHPLDLRLGVAFLQHNPAYGMVRYHKTTGHNGLYHVIHEWDTRGKIDFRLSDNEYIPEMMPYFDLLPSVVNPFFPIEGHNNLNTWSPYSGGVHLRHKRFTACYGEYLERKGFSDTEFEFWCRVNDGLRLAANTASRVAIFPEFIVSRFKDIGVSYRNTDVEKETLKA